MKKRLTILWLICIALFMAGSGTMWGQQPPLIIDQNYGNVNNDFGAGESVTILGNNLTSPTNQIIENGSVGKIKIGGNDAINRVIRVYNGNGYGIGWVSVIRVPADNHTQSGAFSFPPRYTDLFGPNAATYTKGNDIKYATSVATMPADYLNNGYGSYPPAGTEGKGTGAKYQNLIIMSFNSFNSNAFAGQWGNSAPCGYDLFGNSATNIQGDGSASVKVWHHGQNPMLVYQCNAIARPEQAYTTTQGAPFSHTPGGHGPMQFNQDENIHLTQFKGSPMQDAAALANQKMPQSVPGKTSADDTSTNWYIDNYTRPTTVAIGNGSTTLDVISLDTVGWRYEVNFVQVNEVDDYTGLQRHDAGCNSGKFRAYAFHATWSPSIGVGRTHPDAAVQLLNGALVCVAGNVEDKTPNIADMASADANAEKTNALIVWPSTDRATLRTKGNFKANMHHERTAATNTSALYTTANFPDPEADIFLYSKSANTSAHPFAMSNRLGAFDRADITKYSIPAPTQEAKSSIFGVYGDYLHEGKMAEIHTDTVSPYFNGNNPGVIEVGPRTAGKEHYHVYSGGILKNFESCTGLANFTMNFGDNFGKSPHFHITEKHTMYILNYGNNAANACPADIHFYEGATQALAGAFAGADNDGAMQIQALSDVEFRADATIDASVAGNNLYMLSDAGNVVTQKFNYKGKYASETGRGLLTLWAEDRKPEGSDFTDCGNNWSANRNSNRGNIYINDNMKVERSASPTPEGRHTETNMIAANNIRTASFEFDSQNLDHDTTNIISRKGDVWLGYSIGAPVYDATYNGTGNASSNGCNFSNNTFTYKVNTDTNAGELNIKAGWDETDNGKRWEGGNIYFTTINAEMKVQGAYPTNITIPFSNEYYCGSSDPATGDLHERRGESMQRYEHAGIIGGVGRCGREHAWAEYEGKFTNPILEDNADVVGVPSLKYKGNNGNLTVDAGQRGNIIMNTGTELDFQNNQGSAFFRTRFGDIDLRNKTDVSGMQGSLLLLAQRDDLRELSKVGLCGCAEERNNVYLQDFQYTPNESSGSIFIGADNNIKLNYGGLQNKGTRHDPFLSTDYNPGEKIGTDYPCGSRKYHCDMVDDENQARPLMLDFTKAVGPAPTPITQGGFAAVASDYIDVYKAMNYKGGSGSGMSSVPGTGTLHGENVAGYGLYMKTQGNKNNWNTNILKHIPKCPMGCEGGCDKGDYLHMVSRMTFHSDARIFANGQKVYLGSPVIEVFGDLELNTEDESGNGTEIVLQADSLILHDSLIVSGNKLKYRSWSGINGDKPIMKFGYSRRTPPVQEYKYKEEICAPCYSYIPGSTDPKHMLDTITIKFKQGDAYVERLNTAVFDHTVLTFVTDSFDHAQGPPILDARFFIDTMKVRNQVVLYADKKHTRNAHFELISEEQKQSKDYAGLYVRHYHMEPIGACGRNYSELWLTKLENKALDVITTSTFGGFGYQHSDVHVEIKAHLSPGFTSLRLRGQCYEQKCGTLKMKDLRLDGGAQLHFSVGTTKGINGEYSDAIDVEKLTTYGTVDVNIEVRPCERMMNRCYPIIYYKSQTPGSLKNLNLVPKRIKIDGEEVPLVLDTSTEGVVYVCVGNVAPPTVVHSVTIPSIAGVTTTPAAGIAYAVGHSNFEFKAKYSTEKPFVVRTNRMFNGETEVLEGKKNSNGEYEYVIRQVTQNIVLKFGPDYVANMSVNGTAVWSHGETIYIRVEREDIASIYSVAGQLVKRVELPEGDTPIPMQRGVYVVTLKDGSVHKVIVK